MYLKKDQRKGRQGLYQPCPKEPKQNPNGIPQRWDFVEVSKYLKVPVMYVPDYNPISRKLHKVPYLRKDLWALCAYYPHEIFTLEDEHDLMAFAHSITDEDFVTGPLLDLYTIDHIMSIPEFRENPNLKKHKARPCHFASYATINEAQRLIRGKYVSGYTRPLPEYKEYIQAGPDLYELGPDGSLQEFSQKLRKVHEKLNIPTVTDRRAGTWGTNKRIIGDTYRISNRYPTMYRKEILHLMMDYDNLPKSSIWRFILEELLEDEQDLENFCEALELYNFYPYIRRKFPPKELSPAVKALL